MKVKKYQSPNNSTLSRKIVNPNYISILEMEIETKQDIQKSITETTSFIGNDLTKHTIYVMKHA